MPQFRLPNNRTHCLIIIASRSKSVSLRSAAEMLLAGLMLVCSAGLVHSADTDDDDDDSTAADAPAVYLDLRTYVTRLPAGSLPVGFGNSALFTALQSLAMTNGHPIRTTANALGLPAHSTLAVDLPLTVDLSDSISLYAGVSGSTTNANGIDLSSFSLTSWTAGFQAEIHQQNGGLFPTVTLQSTITRAISSGLFSPTVLTNILEFDYALDKDQTRGFLAGIQDTRVALSGAPGEIKASMIGYVGGYYQWPNNWKVTGRGGIQYFGGGQLLNTVHIPPLTQPVLRIDLDRLDDDDNRIFGLTAEVLWTPKPVYQFTLRTPIYFVRN